MDGLASFNMFVGLFVSEYFQSRRNFNAILASMLNKAPYQIAFPISILVILLSFVVYRLLIRLLFGRLSRAELQHLKEHRGPVFKELVGMFVIFLPYMTIGSFVHFMAMYYMALTSKLLEKRIEMLTADRDEQAMLPVQPNWRHGRILLASSFLGFVNMVGINYQWHLKIPSWHFSLQRAVTLHRYLMNLVLLVKSVVLFDEDPRTMFASVLHVLIDGLLIGSHSFIMYQMHKYQIRAATLVRLFIQSGKRLVRSTRDLIATCRCLNQLDSFPVATPEEMTQQSTCSICLDSITPRNDNRRLTNCTHIFHYQCLKSWARSRQECATCRTPF